jgi:hypothetical protein
MLDHHRWSAKTVWNLMENPSYTNAYDQIDTRRMRSSTLSATNDPGRMQ